VRQAEDRWPRAPEHAGCHPGPIRRTDIFRGISSRWCRVFEMSTPSSACR